MPRVLECYSLPDMEEKKMERRLQGSFQMSAALSKPLPIISPMALGNICAIAATTFLVVHDPVRLYGWVGLGAAISTVYVMHATKVEPRSFAGLIVAVTSMTCGVGLPETLLYFWGPDGYMAWPRTAFILMGVLCSLGGLMLFNLAYAVVNNEVPQMLRSLLLKFFPKVMQPAADKPLHSDIIIMDPHAPEVAVKKEKLEVTIKHDPEI